MNDSSIFVRTKNHRRVAEVTRRMTAQERVALETLARLRRDALENDGTLDDEDNGDLATLPYVAAACELFETPTSLGYFGFLDENV